jgi:CRISPR-associated protein Csy3
MTTTVFKKLPGVLSFQRGIVISDALFYNEIAGHFEPHPLPVVRHGIRGTQNINKNGDGDTSVAGAAKRQEVSNIQTTDTAKLSPDADALIVRFSLRFLDFRNALFACAPGAKDPDAEVAALRESIAGFIERARQGEGVAEIGRRYARNIANGRWLWRNRLIARNIAVAVSRNGGKLAEFDALSIPLNRFDDYSEDERRVAEAIADGIRGHNSAMLSVIARIEFGAKGAIEVFPSQNYIEDKPKGFARSLYCLGEQEKRDKTAAVRHMGHAALRDQKVSNALRTIDTWYAEYEAFGRPIPVEPNGANLEAQKFFRNGKKQSAFDLVKQLNALDPASPDGMFVTASLIRGGVFSEGGK